jgi:hypothetical protein
MEVKAEVNAVAAEPVVPRPAPVIASVTFVPEASLTPVQRRVMHAVEGFGLDTFPNADIAGGAALAFVNDCWVPADVDVFFTGADGITALKAIVARLASLPEPVYFAGTARSVLTVYRRGRLPVQLVLTGYPSIVELAAAFDLNVCRVAVSFTSSRAVVTRFLTDEAAYAPGACLEPLPSLVGADGKLPARVRARAVKYAIGGRYKVEPAYRSSEEYDAKMARGKSVEWYGDMTEDAFHVQMRYIGGFPIGNFAKTNGEGLRSDGIVAAALRCIVPLAPGVDLGAAYAGPTSPAFRAPFLVLEPAAVESMVRTLKDVVKNVGANRRFE